MTPSLAPKRIARIACALVVAAFMLTSCDTGASSGPPVTAAEVDRSADAFAVTVRDLPEALRTAPAQAQVGVTADRVLEDQSKALEALERTLERVDGSAESVAETLGSSASDLADKCTDLVDAFETGDQAAAQSALESIAKDSKRFDKSRDELVALLTEK